MVVCVNPRTADYDETIHVLRFSELTQNVVVDRSEGLKVDGLGLAPGRRRANMLYKNQLKELEEVLKGSVQLPFQWFSCLKALFKVTIIFIIIKFNITVVTYCPNLDTYTLERTYRIHPSQLLTSDWTLQHHSIYQDLKTNGLASSVAHTIE